MTPKVLILVHWGPDGYPRTTLPTTEEEALAAYERIAGKKRSGRIGGTESGSGVTVYREPPRLLGIVRGQDQHGQPTMYVVVEEEDERTPNG